jgi:hypothetical protein
MHPDCAALLVCLLLLLLPQGPALPQVPSWPQSHRHQQLLPAHMVQTLLQLHLFAWGA